MENIKIKWYGHSCFKVTYKGYRIAFDPYEDYIPGLHLPKIKADEVICSHGHNDHNYKEGVTIEKNAPNPFNIKLIKGWHDEVKGAKRGENTISLLEADGYKIIHFGDIGEELSKENEELFMDADLVLIPVGGFFTIDAALAKEITDKINAKIIIPMHYRSKDFGFEQIGPVEDFTKLCDNVKIYDGSEIEINKDTSPQVAVLKPFQD
ncbi:L-ascorbate metabolism protein UlaG, beta-lactamase superfamily [Acetitomaculum ruminis DSM 5522]|uniref:L-ascorbate metabolism protein UlaG, beta-lactamase superfamily n=1 Tax=Acetitomaculum ruminis DSM 5522 TaxID=1120918 RepID=A0A1I0XCT1_9FIRM|nr:MBL fold metallo-hydrolase [Acetitomaculum ruminis]SFA98859.1 L-ascorbate metabolism protein UlaG, beta-lactamase superfamily [Acetitomaculum ruminis DSM 5522]